MLPAASYDDMVRVLRILDLPCSWPISDYEVPVEASVKRTTALGSDFLWSIEENERLHWLADLARFAVPRRLYGLALQPPHLQLLGDSMGLPFSPLLCSSSALRASDCTLAAH